MKTLLFSLSLVVEHNHHDDQQYDHYGACYRWFKHGLRRVGHSFSPSPVTELKLSFVIVDSMFASHNHHCQMSISLFSSVVQAWWVLGWQEPGLEDLQVLELEALLAPLDQGGHDDEDDNDDNNAVEDEEEDENDDVLKAGF